ncbi:hypothetical protein P7K49_027963, partial [Saguinus oedipus]
QEPTQFYTRGLGEPPRTKPRERPARAVRPAAPDRSPIGGSPGLCHGTLPKNQPGRGVHGGPRASAHPSPGLAVSTVTDM